MSFWAVAVAAEDEDTVYVDAYMVQADSYFEAIGKGYVLAKKRYPETRYSDVTVDVAGEDDVKKDEDYNGIKS